jgi:triosephosphate isomerase
MPVLVAANWKMFDGPDPEALAERLAGIAGIDVVVAAPYTRLERCLAAGLDTYAQNVHWEPEGAYTGEVSPRMLVDLGVHGSIVTRSDAGTSARTTQASRGGRARRCRPASA